MLPAWAEAFDPAVLTPVTVPRGPTRAWAFDGASGAGIRVAVVDSGVDAAHPAVGAVADGVALRWDRDLQEAVGEAGPHDDLFGHGTACAGIIRRAAPDCTLLSVRVLGEKLSGRSQVFAAGLRWAMEAGARVINMSLSTSNREMAGVFHEIADEAYFRNVMLFCAMNNVPAPTYPSQYSSVVSVAANVGTDPYDLDCNPAPPAEFAAPGIDLEIPWLGGGTIVATGNSFAAPHVAGLVARMLSKHPYLSPSEVKTALRAVSRNAVPAGVG